MLVFMFPGQSSCCPGMLERAIESWPPAAAIVAQASAVLGRDLREHYRSGHGGVSECNEDVQVGVFLTSYLYQKALADKGVVGDLSLGLSLGEYNHLVHIEAIEFDDALRLVAARGRIYDAGPDGMMACVFPLPVGELSGYLLAAQAHGEVVCANLNSPSQTVIAGSRSAVEAAISLIEEEEPGVRTFVIDDRLPMHSPLFRPVAEAFRPHLMDAPWRMPRLPYIPNVGVDGTFLESPGPREIIGLLTQHVCSPVLWRDSIEAIVARHPDARFIEVGPGRVLCNLMQRRWLRNDKQATDDHDHSECVAALTTTTSR